MQGKSSDKFDLDLDSNESGKHTQNKIKYHTKKHPSVSPKEENSEKEAEKKFNDLASMQESNYKRAEKSTNPYDEKVGIQDGKIQKDVVTAIPMIYMSKETNKFELNPDAESFLQGIVGGIGVLSVAGLYRTGKSYLLNKVILNKPNVFQVGPTIMSCTKGLWVYPQVMKVKNQYDQEVNVIVVDTEGIGATDEDKNHDTKIFSLALLLSSFFIYNSMGAIDENAIANLSFVSNIARHIQITNDTKPFFPSFLWVLRDFSLRLVDEYGNDITPKEYLEKALKKNPNSPEGKNAIREYLLKYFTERDCVTLIRPTSEEINLQNLNSCQENTDDNSDGTNKLRPEFLLQVKEIRSKIFGTIKPKEINGKAINSEFFISMIKSYINSINIGCIPNIESAFADFSKSELKSSVDYAIRSVKDNLLSLNLPMEEKLLLKKIREEVNQGRGIIDNRRENNSLKFIDECFKKFSNEIEKLENSILQENKAKSKIEMEAFLKNNYQFDLNIDNYIRNSNSNQCALSSQYSSFYRSFLGQFSDFLTNVKDNSPKGPCSEQILNDFIIARYNEFIDYYGNKIIEQLNISSKKSDEEKSALRSELNKLKQCSVNETSEKNIELNHLKSELENAKKLNQINSVSNDENVKELEKQNKKIKKRLEEVEKSLNDELETLRQAYSKLEEENDKLYKANKDLQGKADKDSMLKDQRIKQLSDEINKLKSGIGNSTGSETSSKESQGPNRTLNKSLSLNVNGIYEKLENQMKNLQSRLENVQEKNIELETKLLEKEKRLENEKSKFEEEKSDMTKTIEDLQNNLNRKEEEYSNLAKESNERVNSMTNDHEAKIQEMERIKSEAEETFESVKSELETKLGNIKKEISKYKQSNDILIYEKDELKDKVNRLDRSLNQLKEENLVVIKENKNLQSLVKNEKLLYESKLKNMEEEISNLNANEEVNRAKTLNKIKELEEELIARKSEYEESSRNYQNAINDLKEDNQLANQKLNLLKKEHEQEISKLNDEIATLQEEESNKINEIMRTTREELTENNRNTKQQIKELKDFYEQEKSQLLNKIENMKNDYEERLAETNKEHEERLSNMEADYKNRIETLEEEMETMEVNNTNYINQLECEINSLNQTVESQASQISESTKSYESYKNQQHEYLLSLQNSGVQERGSLMNKLEDLNNQVKILEKEKSVVSTKHDGLAQNYNRLEESYNALKSEYSEFKQQTNVKTLEAKDIIRQLRQENSDLKLQSATSSALKQQETEYLNKKISEQQEIINKHERESNELVERIKAEIEEEFKESLDKLFKEKQVFEDKYLELKKSYLALESTHLKTKSVLEKEKSVLNEKLLASMKSKDEFIDASEKEREKLLNEIEKLRLRKHDKQDTGENLESLKNKLIRKETLIKDMCTSVENKKQLMQAKIDYLTQQNSEMKNEYSETLKRYESKIADLKSEYAIEKERLEKNFNENREKIELMYKDQVKELKDIKIKGELTEENINNKVRELMDDNKKLFDKLEQAKSEALRNKIDSDDKVKALVEQRLKEMSNSNEGLIRENINIKQLKQQKDEFYNKALEMEKKLIEYESKENLSMFTIEKMKNETNKEKENFLSQIESLKRKITSLEKEKEEIQRKNTDMSKDAMLTSRNKKASLYIPKLRGMSPRFNLGSGVKENKENLSMNTNTHKMTPSSLSFNSYTVERKQSIPQEHNETES